MNGSNRKDDVVLKGSCGPETAKAIQFTFTDADGERQTEWFPFSQVRKISRNQAIGSDDELTVSAWICDAKELVL